MSSVESDGPPSWSLDETGESTKYLWVGVMGSHGKIGNCEQSMVKCSGIFSNTSFLVAFPLDKCLLLAYVILRSLSSATSHLSKITVVESSPVNEELQNNSSQLFMQSFSRERTPAKKASNKQ